MGLKNTDTSYGSVAKTLHWLIALLIILAWIIGSYAVDLPNTDASKPPLFTIHKSIGMLVLMLAIVRLSWRLYGGAPRFVAMNRLLVPAAYTVHYLLYLFMFLQPLTGWAMSSAAGYTPTFFGLFTFPPLVQKNAHLAMEFEVWHNTFAVVLLALFIMHVGAALVHHFVFKDNTLRRMTVD